MTVTLKNKKNIAKTTKTIKIISKERKIKDICSQVKINKFSHLFSVYINQIFGDIGAVRPNIYELYGNKKHNKHFRFGFVQFHRYDDLSEDDEDYDKNEYDDANTKGAVPMDEAQYYPIEKEDDEESAPEFEYEDTENNHHVLYDMENETYLDSVSTVGYKYQNQERDEHDSLCQSYTLMFFFGRKMDNDPVKKQMQIIKMYEWLINNKNFTDRIKEDIFYVDPEKREVWEDEHGNRISTQGPKYFDKLIKKIKNTLKIWKEYGYRHFIGDGSCNSHKNYDIEDYDLSREDSDNQYEQSTISKKSVDYDSIFGESSDEDDIP
tara:strand:- start:191 stop:1156 length:966 start_codon:yes stop_codon:yes gene_type:complete